MEIREDNKYWIDENNNKWTKSIYNKKQAIKLSRTLVKCKDCVDCKSCDSCYSCDSCDFCNSCDLCNSCNSCYSCNSCNSCDFCYYCKSCDSCYFCNSCDYCNYCDYCKSCNSCDSCDSCDYCNFCKSCDSCDFCKNFKKNPNRYAQKGLGFNWKNTCIYWTCEDDVQVVCGCFIGSIDEFKKAVIKKYNKNHEYIKFVKIVEMLIKMERE